MINMDNNLYKKKPETALEEFSLFMKVQTTWNLNVGVWLKNYEKLKIQKRKFQVTLADSIETIQPIVSALWRRLIYKSLALERWCKKMEASSLQFEKLRMDYWRCCFIQQSTRFLLPALSPRIVERIRWISNKTN